jgi:hypothetical protein
MAISSLVLGVASFTCWIFTGLPAVLLGVLALRNIYRSNGQLKGEGLAIGGIITGGITSFFILPVMIALLLPAVQAARETARQNMSMNNMKQITIAMHNYAVTHGSTFPAPGGDGAGSQLSWRVHILPYIEQQALYEKFHLDEPWDSDHNRALVAQMPDVFRDPAGSLPPGKTLYLAVTGPGTAFDDPQTGPRIASFSDGTSNTIVLVEADADQAVEWTKPQDWQFDPTNPTRGLGGLRPSVFLAATADAAVRRIPNDTPPATIGAMMTRAGREAVDLP